MKILHTDSTLHSALHSMFSSHSCSHFRCLTLLVFLSCLHALISVWLSINPLIAHCCCYCCICCCCFSLFFFVSRRFFSLHFFQWPVGMCACLCVYSYVVITHQCHFERWKAHTSHSFSIPICHHKNPWPLSLFYFGHLVDGKCSNSCNNLFNQIRFFHQCSLARARVCVCKKLSYRW